MSAISVVDEATHAPGTHRFWSESYYFNFFDPRSAIAGAARIGFSPNRFKGLRIAGWIRNLTNTYYLSSELNSTVGNTAAYAAPRTFGGKIEYAF